MDLTPVTSYHEVWPGEKQEDEEGRAVLDEVADRRLLARREPDRRFGSRIPWSQHSEPDRGHAVEEISQRIPRRRGRVEEEPSEPFGLVIV